MDVFEAIETRRAVRKYLDLGVEWDKVVKIVEAGKAAPSAGNLQNWKFIIIINKDKIRKVAQACGEQYWMEQAPLIVVVCSVSEKSKVYYGVRGEKFYDVQNCAAAVQNMLLAGTAQGLSSCWVGFFDETELNSLLEVPSKSKIQAVLTFGYPDETPLKPAKYALDAVAFLEKYGGKYDSDISNEEFAAMRQRQVKAAVKGVSDSLQKVGSKIKERIEEHQKNRQRKKDEEELERFS